MSPLHNYLSPDELIQKYPQVKDISWTSSKIGVFFSAGLLLGKISKKEKKAFILESSFIELIEYYNNVTLKKHLFVYPKV